MHGNFDTKFRSREIFRDGSGYLSVVHTDDLFAEIEPHAESGGSGISYGVLFKQLFHIDSIESFSVVLDRYMNLFIFPMSFYDNRRISGICEFYRIVQEIGDNLLELYPVDLDESHFPVNPIYKLDSFVHTRVYIIFRFK